jgi:hypothetical protein
VAALSQLFFAAEGLCLWYLRFLLFKEFLAHFRRSESQIVNEILDIVVVSHRKENKFGSGRYKEEHKPRTALRPAFKNVLSEPPDSDGRMQMRLSPTPLNARDHISDCLTIRFGKLVELL